MIIGIFFLREEEMLVIRKKNAYNVGAYRYFYYEVQYLLILIWFGSNEYHHLVEEELVNDEQDRSSFSCSVSFWLVAIVREFQDCALLRLVKCL